MKTHRRFTLGILAGLGLALAILAPDALAQQKSPLVGTWHVTSAQLLMSDNKEVLRPYGVVEMVRTGIVAMRRGTTSSTVNPAKTTAPHIAAADEDVSYSV